MPFVTARFAAHLLALHDDADAVVPRTERGYHPLCAVYTRACQPAVARRLGGPAAQDDGLLDDVRVRVVDGDELARVRRSPTGCSPT